MGGGDRDISEDETNRFASEIATANNSYERWLETRSLEERVAIRSAEVRAEDGSVSTVEVPPLAEGATSTPEGFGTTADADAEPEE